MTDEQMNIQWYPGHMTKTRRRLEEDLRLVDAVCEIVDARIPASSRNPDIDAICGDKPRMVILNRIDMADARMTDIWAANLRRYAEKGFVNKPLKLMVVGIPNVGKSSFINQIAGRKGAKAENRPGVTRGTQWVTVDRGLLLLDTPGILWPKFDDEEVGRRLAYTGAVKDDVLDCETLAANLMRMLWQCYPDALRERYKLDSAEDGSGFALLESAAKKRSFLLSGGVADTERMARVLLEEFRSCKIGRFTLEAPDEI